MAISEKSRSTIYASFTELMGEEAAAEMMRYLPVRDVDEPATRADLELGLEVHRSQLAGMKVDLADVESSLRSEIVGLRADVGQVESSLRPEIAAVAKDVTVLEANLRAEMHRMHNRLLAEIGILIGIATTVLAVLR